MKEAAWNLYTVSCGYEIANGAILHVHRIVYIFSIWTVGHQNRDTFRGTFRSIDITPDETSTVFEFDSGIVLKNVVVRGLINVVEVGSKGVRHSDSECQSYCNSTHSQAQNMDNYYLS